MTEHTAQQPPTEMTLDDAVAYATRLHRAGQLDGAETLYRRVLDVAPDHPDALNFLAIARYQRGQAEEAIALMQRSLELRPDAPGVWINLGNILLDQGRFDDAGEAYEASLRLAPDDLLVRINLGVLRRSQGRPEEAEAAYREALALDPKNIDAHNNLGNLLAGLGRIDEAVHHYCRTIELMPANPSAREMLGYAYCMLGRHEEAAEMYRTWLAQEPDNPTARHHLAACTGENVPDRAADVYVERVFDGFADSFDAKLAGLTYRAPQLVAGAVENLFSSAHRRLDVLDAGCGTGLCGPLLAPYAQSLVGVDLSQSMLHKAEGRGVYNALIKAELTAFLQQTEAGSYDLIVSADTLCYFGALEEVFAGAMQALKAGGALVFTVEMIADADLADDHGRGYLLAPHGRYAHRPAYVSRTLAAGGFVDIAATEVELRTEGGKPVRGLLCTARKASTL